MGDGVSLPIPPQFGCDECILTHITLYLNQKGGKSRAKLVGSSWYLTPLLWDTPSPYIYGSFFPYLDQPTTLVDLVNRKPKVDGYF